MNRVYVCSCFGITEQQVRDHADTGACTPRQIASACKAGTDCGGCVKRIQALLGRGACPRRQLLDRGEPTALAAQPSRIGTDQPSITAAQTPTGTDRTSIGTDRPSVGAEPPSIGTEPPSIGVEPPPYRAEAA